MSALFDVQAFDLQGRARCGMDWHVLAPRHLKTLAGARRWARAWAEARPSWVKPETARIEVTRERQSWGN